MLSALKFSDRDLHLTQKEDGFEGCLVETYETFETKHSYASNSFKFIFSL